MTRVLLLLLGLAGLAVGGYLLLTLFALASMTGGLVGAGVVGAVLVAAVFVAGAVFLVGAFVLEGLHAHANKLDRIADALTARPPVG